MTSVRWNELYPTEKELIEDMHKTRSDANKYPYYTLVKGYEFINGFKKYYQKNGTLTEKQMTQLKRLANEVHTNAMLYGDKTKGE